MAEAEAGPATVDAMFKGPLVLSETVRPLLLQRSNVRAAMCGGASHSWSRCLGGPWLCADMMDVVSHPRIAIT
jgi:hypothetical protein